MMKPITAGLGILTMFAVTGAMTPSGQAMLGARPAQTAPSLAVITDPPATVPARHAAVPARPASAAVPAPAPRAAAVPARTVPVRQPDAAVPRSVPVTAQPGTPGGFGQMANVANILLNLPQVLGGQSQGPVRQEPDGPAIGGAWPRGHGHGPHWKHDDNGDVHPNDH